VVPFTADEAKVIVGLADRYSVTLDSELSQRLAIVGAYLGWSPEDTIREILTELVNVATSRNPVLQRIFQVDAEGSSTAERSEGATVRACEVNG